MDEATITVVMKELCYIYHQRNMLGRERDSLRHKYRYLQDIKRSMQVRDNFESSDLYKRTRKTFNLGYNQILDEGHRATLATTRLIYLDKNPVPKRFKDTRLSEINMMLLEAEAKVCKIKVKVMKHTKKYEKRIKELAPTPEHFTPRYMCGIVRSLGFYNTEIDEWFTITANDMKRYHDECLADRAIDKMLRE